MFKEGQRYAVQDNETRGIVYKVNGSMITLRRTVDYSGKKCNKLVELARNHLEESVLSGNIILLSGDNDPNFSFRMRKNDVRS